MGKHPSTDSDICTFLYFGWFFEFRLFVFLVFSAIPVSLITYFYVSLAIKLRDRVGPQETPKAKRAARMVLGFVISFIVLSLPYQVSSSKRYCNAR